MASSISAGTTNATALVHTADTSGALELKTNNGTTAVTIDTSQNVGIGTASPTNGKLVIAGSIVTTAQGIRLTADTADARFICESATLGAGILGTFSNHSQLFYTNSVEQARIDSSGNFKFNSGYGSAAAAYGCRAWVNFNGQGTIAIRGSGNVSSITDNGTGSYSVNYTTAMPDANYASVVSTEEGGIISVVSGNNGFQQTAGVGRIGVYVGTGNSGYDPEQVNYIVLR